MEETKESHILISLSWGCRHESISVITKVKFRFHIQSLFFIGSFTPTNTYSFLTSFNLLSLSLSQFCLFTTLLHSQVRKLSLSLSSNFVLNFWFLFFVDRFSLNQFILRLISYEFDFINPLFVCWFFLTSYLFFVW